MLFLFGCDAFKDVDSRSRIRPDPCHDSMFVWKICKDQITLLVRVDNMFTSIILERKKKKKRVSNYYF